MRKPVAPWSPTVIRRYIESLGTSTNVIRVETDQGEGFLKALGNPEGPHVLACEWVGTQLARRIGLPTLDHALITVEADDELPFLRGGRAAQGPAFITRREEGSAWGGGATSLSHLVDETVPVRMIVFDNWIANCDRHARYADGRVRCNPDNLFLSREAMPKRRIQVKAIDHSHAFTCGRDLSPSISHMTQVEDDTIYGLFPALVDLLTPERVAAAMRAMNSVPEAQLTSIVDSVPAEWLVDRATRRAWVAFLIQRRDHLSATLEARLMAQGILKV